MAPSPVENAMRKLRIHKGLRSSYRPFRTARAAFSLAELVISIGILILMMALAGEVFTITIRSTGQATALTEITQSLRTLEDTLREDLRNVQPGQSLILIQGNPVNAYWTREQKDADALVDGKPDTGYPHVKDPERERADATGAPVLDSQGDPKLEFPRADMLMFFTSRRASSYSNPSVSGTIQQIVYGHAELGDYTPTPNATPTSDAYTFTEGPEAFPADATTGYSLDPAIKLDASKVPASHWHLARRSLLLVPTPRPKLSDVLWNPDLFGPNKKGLSDARLLRGETDVIWGFPFEQLVLRPLNIPHWNLPQIFHDPQGNFVTPSARSQLDVTPPPIYANRMGSYFLPHCASFKVEWSLDPKSPFVAGRLDGTSEVFWFDPGEIGDPTDPVAHDPLRSLETRLIELKKGGARCPSGSGASLCASLDSLLNDRTAQTLYPGGLITPYSLSDRFRGQSYPDADPNYAWHQLAPDGRPNLQVFTANRPGALGTEPVPDDIWPGALRITVDVFDREGRLERPIRHVMVIPVGG